MSDSYLVVTIETEPTSAYSGTQSVQRIAGVFSHRVAVLADELAAQRGKELKAKYLCINRFSVESRGRLLSLDVDSEKIYDEAHLFDLILPKGGQGYGKPPIAQDTKMVCPLKKRGRPSSKNPTLPTSERIKRYRKRKKKEGQMRVEFLIPKSAKQKLDTLCVTSGKSRHELLQDWLDMLS